MFNLDQDPYEEVDLAVEKKEKLNGMKELAREWAADLKVAFQPNRFLPEILYSNFAFFRFSLGYPRYHKGLLEPRGQRYVLIINFYVESGQKMIQFNIQFKIESRIFIQ